MKKALSIDAHVGEQIAIGDGVVVTVEEKSGRRVRLRFEADDTVRIKKVDNRDTNLRVMRDLGVNVN